MALVGPPRSRENGDAPKAIVTPVPRRRILRTSPVERACALFGKDHVWAFADEIKRARQDLMIFRTYHPSPRLMNTRPKCRKDFEETYQEIKNFLMV